MAWNDRIREAAYTSPSGVRTVLIYEDVSLSIEKKTTGFSFPDADGTFVQDLGHTGRKYPLRVFFTGNDYDQQADAFLETLLERGTGKLEHPIYGTVDVVPFGRIGRKDALKTAANQAVFEITFWATIGLVYPAAQADPASAVLAAVAEYNVAAADTLAESTDLDSAVERTGFKNSYNVALDATKSGLDAVADTQENVSKQFNAVYDSISQGIDTLVGTPTTLAFQTTILIQAPARALTNILARLAAYRDLISQIVDVENGQAQSNDFHGADLYVSTYVTGSIVSVVNNQFATKTEALEAAEEILAQLEAVTVWRDENYQNLGEIDTGETYQQLQEAVALTAGFLVEISFALKQERCIVLDRDRTVLDLEAQLYGTVDENFDFIVNSNALTGSEILELPKGREIVYYI